jgi:hypothetical protein
MKIDFLATKVVKNWSTSFIEKTVTSNVVTSYEENRKEG